MGRQGRRANQIVWCAKAAYALGAVELRTQKHLVLIHAREFASTLATPTVITDERGNLVYYNEAAEHLLGRSFAEMGELGAEEWRDVFSPRTLDDTPLRAERTPGGQAVLTQRPAHGEFRITSLDGVLRDISVTAFPLFAHVDEFVGVVAIFWDV
jgi:PAS domain S-box-containing protein